MSTETQCRIQALGFIPQQLATLSWALNAANTWLGFSFDLQYNRTLNRVQAYVSGVNGVLGANDLTCDIYSDNGGPPLASLAATNVVTATPAGAAHVEFTGFTLALTAGVRYWVILKNVNATPAVNYPTYLYGHEFTLSSYVPGNPAGQSNWGHTKVTSLDGGATWATQPISDVASFRLQFADGTYAGFPIEGTGAEDTNAVYSTREIGMMFTTPAGPSMNVDMAAMFMDKIGTPTGNMVYRLRDSSHTLLATSIAIPQANISGVKGYYGGEFAATVTLAPGSTYSITMGETANADAAANRFRSWYFQIENSVPTRGLMPFQGSAIGIYFDGAVWSTLPTQMFPFIIGQSDQIPFVVSGGGGGSLHLRLGL